VATVVGEGNDVADDAAIVCEGEFVEDVWYGVGGRDSTGADYEQRPAISQPYSLPVKRGADSQPVFAEDGLEGQNKKARLARASLFCRCFF
jgi:hypothetical protein